MAEVVGVHGIKGVLKLKVFSSTPDTLTEEPLCDEQGKPSLKIVSLKAHGNIYLAEVTGVKDRTAAEKMRGIRLYLPRTALPAIEEKNTFYHTDLVGLAAKYPDGRVMGKIISVANFGAGDLLEIKPVKGASFYVPFTGSIVPLVNIEKKEVVVDPPAGLLD